MRNRLFNFIDKYIWLMMLVIFLVLTIFIYIFWDWFWNHIFIFILLWVIFFGWGSIPTLYDIRNKK